MRNGSVRPDNIATGNRARGADPGSLQEASPLQSPNGFGDDPFWAADLILKTFAVTKKFGGRPLLG